MPMVKCNYCGKEILKEEWIIKKGRRYFCNRECCHKYRKGNEIEIDENMNCAKMKVKYKGAIVIVLLDLEDINKIKTLTWSAKFQKDINNYYILANIKDKNNKKTTIFLHRFITNCQKGLTVDHINHDTTDNRKKNLRICTQKENNLNQDELRANNKSGYRNISWQKASNAYIITLHIDGKNKTIGRTPSLEEAIKIRDEAKRIYGVKSVYNFKRLSTKGK